MGDNYISRNPDMTTFTLERAETQHTPAARCTFTPNGKSVEVTVLHLTSAGWGETMGRGSGFYTVKHAREFYAALLGRGYTAA
jgi:hypothetical protein